MDHFELLQKVTLFILIQLALFVKIIHTDLQIEEYDTSP